MKKKKYLLVHQRAVGDMVCLTALLRDLHLTYPDQLITDVFSTVRPVWNNNPYITPLWDRNQKLAKRELPKVAADVTVIHCDYGQGIKDQRNETVHFCSYFHRDWQRKTNMPVRMHKPFGDLHLTEEEKADRRVNGRYWLCMVGGKTDFPVKIWYDRYWQQVADALAKQGLGFVQTGMIGPEHIHPRLSGPNVIDLVGAGDFREFLKLVYHAEGVICGVTGAMHMAAAIEKPCVVIGGAREAWWWEAYVNENKGFAEASGQFRVPHRYLHTIGLLDCVPHCGGCWKNKVVPGGKDRSICKYPVITPTMAVAKCMEIIRPEHVMDAVMSYYTDHTLPPIVPTEPITLPVISVAPAKIVKQGVSVNRPVTPSLVASAPVASLEQTMASPNIGGKVTIFVLLYGGEEYYEMHASCLQSIIRTIPAAYREIRIGSNALNAKSTVLVTSLMQSGDIRLHYAHTENAYKYPVMREMFFDAANPIETKWVLWFDDDSICDVDQNWFHHLTAVIASNSDQSAHMIGNKFSWKLSPEQRRILARQPWYKNRHWCMHNGRPTATGNTVIFATGGFWAITTEAIRAADIPDLNTGLQHNGGDWQIGAQLHQAGYTIKQWNGQKRFVRTSSVPRRGVTTPMIGTIAKTAVQQVPRLSIVKRS